LGLDIVRLIYELSRDEYVRHVRESNVYWVSDLVRCLLKRNYELIYPELRMREVFIPTLISGNLIHKGLQSVLKERFGGNVSVEVEASREVVLPTGDKVVIKGRADAIVSTDEGRVGIEIKTSRSDLNIPHEQHLEQVMIYNWLMDLNYSLLIYITPDRITQFTVLDRLTEADVVDRISNPTYPRYSWECNYCTYSVLCPYKKVVSSK
jgi:CRISPR-associated exonuclease Cas4